MSRKPLTLYIANQALSAAASRINNMEREILHLKSTREVLETEVSLIKHIDW